MRWVARAVLAALVLAGLYGLWRTPTTTNGVVWPLTSIHTNALLFILVMLGYTVLAVCALALLFLLIRWCVRTGWPEENGA